MDLELKTPNEKARGAGTGRAPLRVLFLPKNSRHAYFKSFLAAARASEGWDIFVATPKEACRLWRGAVSDDDKFQLIPDFNARPQWEDDPEHLAEIDALIAECEQVTRTSAGRIVLAGERDLGRGYSWPIYYWPSNRTARRALVDNREPFRILRRMFAFARDILDIARPDFVLAGEWADPLCFTVSMVARQRSIPCVANRYSKVANGRCFWSASPMMYNDLRATCLRGKRQRHAPISAEARNHIHNFRDCPAMLDYIKANWRLAGPDNWVRRHEDIARAIFVEMRHRLLKRAGLLPKSGWQMLHLHYRSAWLEWRNARFFRRFDEQELTKARYIYMALHKDPEQSLNYQAPYWAYQPYTVGLVSSCLPCGYRLFVREHRANLGRRPPRFYKEMGALPGVVLVDGYDDQFKYIRNADLIVTDNGSSGWEGLRFGKRVITLADTFYDGTGLEHRVREPEQLATAVVERLEEPPVKDPEAHDRELGWLLDAECESSAPLESADHAEAFALLSRILAQSVTEFGDALSPA